MRFKQGAIGSNAPSQKFVEKKSGPSFDYKDRRKEQDRRCALISLY